MYINCILWIKLNTILWKVHTKRHAQDGIRIKTIRKNGAFQKRYPQKRYQQERYAQHGVQNMYTQKARFHYAQFFGTSRTKMLRVPNLPVLGLFNVRTRIKLERVYTNFTGAVSITHCTEAYRTVRTKRNTTTKLHTRLYQKYIRDKIVRTKRHTQNAGA